MNVPHERICVCVRHSPQKSRLLTLSITARHEITDRALEFDHQLAMTRAMNHMRTLVATCTMFLLSVCASAYAADSIRVLVWDEQQPEQRKAYGDQFLGETIAAHLASLPGLVLKSTSLDAPDNGLSAATLDSTDVIVWWSHKKNKDLPDEVAERVVTRVQQGRLALVAVHSAHWAKPFVRLMQERAKSDALNQIPEAERASARIEYVNDQPYGKLVKANAPLTPSLTRTDTGWRLALPGCIFPTYRTDGAPSHLTTLLPDHPLAAGLPKQWDIPQTEMYGEPFHVPTPDAVVFEERWDKGEHFRSGCVWQVGKGRVVYFRPGHETYPVFKQREPLRVIENAVRWLGAEVLTKAP